MNEAGRTIGELERLYQDDSSFKKKDADERALINQEVRRFVRWFGPDRELNTIRPDEIERYTEDVQRTAAGGSAKLGPVRDMLAWARKKKHLDESRNLATHIRVRRATKAGGKGQTLADTAVQMTREGHEQLSAELERLIGNRPEVARQIALARADGDLKENAPYHAAREVQGQAEARIRDLEATLKVAVVVDTNATSSEKVAVGRTVSVLEIEENDESQFTIVSPSEVDFKAGRISTASPIGRALMDRMVGDEFDVTTPGGAVRYRVLAIT